MKQSNIIALIGMTGCGKTSVGRMLAKRLGADFVDLDEEIVSRYGAVKDIFAEKGETGFRKIECEVLRDVLAAHRERLTILSTGGGAPTYPPSRALIRSSTYSIWLRRGVDTIPKDSPILTRPPVNGSIENYKKLLGARYPVYRSTADMTVYNVYPQRTAAVLTRKIQSFKHLTLTNKAIKKEKHPC